MKFASVVALGGYRPLWAIRSIISTQVRVWLTSDKARATVSFASSVDPMVLPAADTSRTMSWRPVAGFIIVPLTGSPTMPRVGDGVGLVAALFEAAKPTTAEVDSFVVADLKIAAITAMFWVLRLMV